MLPVIILAYNVETYIHFEIVCSSLSCGHCDGDLSSDCYDSECMNAITVAQEFDVCVRMLA